MCIASGKLHVKELQIYIKTSVCMRTKTLNSRATMYICDACIINEKGNEGKKKHQKMTFFH